MSQHFPQAARGYWVTADFLPAADWLRHGFLARGNFTLLTGPWKGGKSTLFAMLLARRHTGGTLAGLAVQPGKSVVATEESAAVWAERARRYDFGGQVCFFPQPFLRIPYAWEWREQAGSATDGRGFAGNDLLTSRVAGSAWPAHGRGCRARPWGMVKDIR